MSLNHEEIDQLLELVNQTFPDWQGFTDPRFEKEEVHYKHATIAKARELLSETELRRLIDAGNFDEFIDRLDTIGQDNNLLWRNVPSAGDLNILYQEDLDRPSFCKAVFDLLYGSGPPHQRLERYAQYVDAHDLPNKWTFPTYFLFICHPDTEMFVKPHTTGWFVKSVNALPKLPSDPSSSDYIAIKQAATELREALAEYEPRDMVDIQGFVWTCYSAHRKREQKTLTEERRREFERLYEEFLSTYLPSEEGQQHAALHQEARQQAQRNFTAIKQAVASGEDATDAILLKLLPYSNTKSNRASGAWIHWAPAITGDLKGWFEGVGWTDKEDWPRIGQAIFDFVNNCVQSPERLEEECERFVDLPYTTGFQTGMLTPILNALDPDHFLLVNNKSRGVINHLAEASFSQKLDDYPDANATGIELIEELEDVLEQADTRDLHKSDLFDMFCHWYVAVRETGPEAKLLAEPFSRIFQDRQEAEWAFDLLQETLRRVGIEDPDDERFAITVPSRYGGRPIHLNLGSWLVLGFRGPDLSEERVRITLIADHIEIDERFEEYHFAEGDDGIDVRGYGLPAEMVRPLEGQLREVYEHTLDHIAGLLQHWSRSPQRNVHMPAIAEAVFDPTKREKLFQEGIGAQDTVATVRDGYFSPQTFQLLGELHHNPTRDFYSAHKDDFESHLEEPFQQLMYDVAGQLPREVTTLMETESRIFARIPKNDYGRGGAWDFYWGAFYPKGGRRIADAQLFLRIDRGKLEYGFYIGEYADEQRRRFTRNLQASKSRSREALGDILAPRDIQLGEAGDSLTLDEWLSTSDEEDLVRVVKIMPRREVLRRSREELTAEISSTFATLFPLVLLAVKENPWQDVGVYLRASEEEEPEIQPPYSIDDIVAQTQFERDLIDAWLRGIERKKQAIIYGPPGTGKTYVAEHLARHLIGGSDGFMDIVQFHPAYAYEDFIQGIRPQRVDGGLDYPTVPGRFLSFCEKAASRDGLCVLIIDEINRANLARVFGELMYLLEYRDRKVPLAGGGELEVPSNVRIIGTMNTADRSIALVDHALRRRFAFLALYPNYDVLRRYHQGTGFPVDGLINTLRRLNRKIDDPHYEVGITFFLREDLPAQIGGIWQMEIEPYLEEYFFDQRDTVEQFRWERVREDISP